MRFSAPIKEFAHAVATAAKVVNAHLSMLPLLNVYIEAKGNVVTARATDLRTTIITKTGAEVIEAGECALDARILSGYLSNLPPGMIELFAVTEGNTTWVHARTDTSEYEFPTIDSSTYPPVPPLTKKQPILDMNAARFKEAVEGTLFAASTDESRGPALACVLVEIENGVPTFVATDGYRLAVRRPPANLSEGTFRFIVPTLALREAVRNLTGTDVVRIVGYGKNGATAHLGLLTGTTTIIVRLVDGTYPTYEAVIPTNPAGSITVPRDATLAALQRARLASEGRAKAVTLEIVPGELIITATSDLSGSAREVISAKTDVAETTLSVNAGYLIDALAHSSGVDVVMDISGDSAPMRLHEPGVIHDLQIVMPLKPQTASPA